jgi:uncharacterized protein YegP (UPF0339 family)
MRECLVGAYGASGIDSEQRGGTLAGKFVLKRGTTGKFRFSLLASNGKMIATSEAYETKAAALRGIESVRTNAPNARLEDDTGRAGPNNASGGSRTKGGRIGRALQRDWEQTKADLPGLHGKDLHQDVDDTIAQATGERQLPAKNKPNRR